MTVFLESSSDDSRGPIGDGVANGSHHAAFDLVVLATGFRTTQFLYQEFPNGL